MSELDRTALAFRNLHLATEKRRRRFKQSLRGLMLWAFSKIPVKKQPGGTNRVLLIRPDHLGDLLLAVPAIRAIKTALPDISLHALVGSWGKPAIERLDELTSIETIDFPAFTRQPQSSAFHPYQLAWQTAAKLRQTGYDAALILRPDHWWGAMLAHMAGIPRIIGFDTYDTRHFLTQRVTLEPTQHAVRQNLALASALTNIDLSWRDAALFYPVTDTDRAQADALLAEFGATGQPIACIHVGSGTRTKQWEAARWGVVGDTLAEKLGAFIVFTGSPSEHELCVSAAEHMTAPHGIAAGKTTLGGLAALLEQSRVVLGPDSGPLHLAAAVGAPTVALFGPASVAEFGTWGNKNRHAVLTSDIGCLGCRILDWPDDAPENHPCVRDITLQQVVATALRVVG